jgi:serine protease Do
MTNKRLLFLAMAALLLSIGVIIGTIVTGGAEATFEQKAAALAIPDPVSLSNTFSQIAEKLDPAVVKIKVIVAPRQSRARQDRRQPVPSIPGLPPDLFNFGIPRDPRDEGGEATGTGFIVDKSGFIMTNHHVVDRSSKIEVELSDGSKHTAKLVGSDEGSDLGLIKIEAGRDLPTAKFGNSDAVKVGDWVLAIGSPFGFDHTVTSGIISAKGRDNSLPQFGVDQNLRGLQSFLQTDAAINPGNSGGPLVNMAGEVIGVNTAIVSETNSFAGLGFALPSNTAVKVYNQLSQNGKVTRGSIGITYRSVTDENELDAYGVKGPQAVIVDGVVPGSPADKAGLRAHDVITEIDGTKISTGSQLQNYIVDRPVGSTVRLGFSRDGRTQTTSVSIGDRADVLAGESSVASSNSPTKPSPRDQGGASSRLGITVEPVSQQLRRQFNLSGGVAVSSVEENSLADEAGLGEDMIITGIVTDRRFTPINNVGDFQSVESKLKPGSSLVLSVRVPPQYDRDIPFSMKVK